MKVNKKRKELRQVESEKFISLDKFAYGALAEKFNIELQKISQNIYDPNTSKTAKRTLTIKLEIKPDENSEIGDVTISALSTLAPAKSIGAKVIFGYDEHNKKGVVSELKADMLGQIDFDEVEKELKEKSQNIPDNIVDLQKID